MIKNLLPIYLLLIAFTSQAQVCELPNGNMEVWVDYTAEFEELAEQELAIETLIAPEGFGSAFRFLEVLFSAFFEEMGTENFPVVVSNMFGTKRSTDATEGEFALQFGADKYSAISDLISFDACNGSLPTIFSFDLKHVGNVIDTLSILGSFGETSDFPESEEQINEFSGFFFEQIINETSTEYQNISIPIEVGGNEIAADSFSLFLLLSSNEESISRGDTSYYLIDNMQFKGPNDATTSTKYLSLPNKVDIYPTIFKHNINIKNENDLLEGVVYTLDGQRKATLTIPHGQSHHDLSFISHPGSYLLKMIDPNTRKSTSKILVKH